MPSEISHVVYAARVLTNISSTVTDPIYWIGTLLPNIRRLGVRTRYPLHVDGVSLYSLIGADDFTTGMRVHSWIDLTCDQYWRETHIDDKLPWHPLSRYAFALLEDELLYDHFDDWNLLHRLLNQAQAQESALIQDSQVIGRWHSILQDYMAAKPSETTRRKMMAKLGLSRKTADEVNDLVNKYASEATVQEAMNGMWRYVEDLLQ